MTKLRALWWLLCRRDYVLHVKGKLIYDCPLSDLRICAISCADEHEKITDNYKQSAALKEAQTIINPKN